MVATLSSDSRTAAMPDVAVTSRQSAASHSVTNLTKHFITLLFPHPASAVKKHLTPLAGRIFVNLEKSFFSLFRQMDVCFFKKCLKKITTKYKKQAFCSELRDQSLACFSIVGYKEELIGDVGTAFLKTPVP